MSSAFMIIDALKFVLFAKLWKKVCLDDKENLFVLHQRRIIVGRIDDHPKLIDK